MGDGRTEERTSGRARSWLQGLVGRGRDPLERFGLSSDALLLIVKSVVAATLGWLIAEVVLNAPSSTFAPFSAVLMLHATVSRSVNHSFGFAAAMTGGVALAGALVPLLGPSLGTFALLVLLASLLGRWRKLGSQGVQVTVAAMFSYAAFFQADSGPSSWLHLASIAGLVVLGCFIGVGTNLVIVPPLRYRTAEHSVRILAQQLCGLLGDIAACLRAGHHDSNQVDAWWDRANELQNTVAQARSSVEDAAETLRLNPRRLLLRQNPSFAGHRRTVSSLERATEQLRSLTRAFSDISRTGHLDDAQQAFLRSYADVLDAAAAATRVLGELHTYADLRQDNDLDHHIHQGRTAHQYLNDHINAHRLDDRDHWPVYEALHTDGRRLVEELARAEHELAQLDSTTPSTR
ncbi:uncharacterized membrane protein YgaE (UPF0421/DUF939 family) [Halopolyspora algeriensis]|uniref:Uncharacterized membrane protein YgaE (UPF0421/DUF939 family) n=1 Tax=Halopolyspora algeriensis TaxID=1500506 RepID=A0A368VTN6_9ACTN|nr:FUSC family protein [Halopolyspora algeriensis]RCW45350.1 uncharacterized membrane protein YgaE (UPF0421/DUF939 family) [Halopolyspora algeriensis]TQM47390.1 uncharacterized membrane protein YgaE (UPF0421/DUF939 family) [Halopolyspora algeriensis]